jgi:hypothetical protein
MGVAVAVEQLLLGPQVTAVAGQVRTRPTVLLVLRTRVVEVAVGIIAPS